jgi:hypothetical protein
LDFTSFNDRTAQQRLNSFTGNLIYYCRQNFLDASEIIAFEQDVDVYAAVLPTEILISLFKALPSDKELIIPSSKRLPTGNKVFNPATNQYEQEYMFVHGGWKKLICAEFETIDLI